MTPYPAQPAIVPHLMPPPRAHRKQRHARTTRTRQHHAATDNDRSTRLTDKAADSAWVYGSNCADAQTTHRLKQSCEERHLSGMQAG